MIGSSHQAFSGWYGGGNRIGSITDTTATATSINNNLLVRPSYYVNWDGVTNSQAQGGLYAGGASSAFDLTGIGTNHKKFLSATTFRVGSNWMTTAPSDGFTSGFGIYDTPDTNGNTLYFQNNAYKSGGDYGFSCGAGGDVRISISTFDANYRNTWLTYVVATSDNPTVDFANWGGPSSDGLGNGWASRAYLINAETGVIIATAYDGWNYQSIPSYDLTQSWTLGYGTSSRFVNEFMFFSGDISQYYRTDVEFLSHWWAWGSTVDPFVYYKDFVGTGISSTIGGVKAWTRWTFGSAGTLITNGSDIDVGYSQLIDNQGSRVPAGTYCYIQLPYFTGTAETIPTFTSL